VKETVKAIVKKSATMPAAPTKAAVKETAKSAAKPAEKAATPVAAPAKVASGSPVLMPIGTASSGGIPRAGRPSSRLASLTVPSMAQSVASTAAKASYAQIESNPMIAPPLPSSIKKDPKLANNWKTTPADKLSDAELMAMSDDDYMNDKQLAAFRHRLVQLKNDILANAGETTEHLREDTVVVPDPADRATIEEEHALELRTRDRERKLLKKIEQSISRIDAGDYGYCDETGEPIGVGRLLARPTATLSLEAQQRRELKQKMFGD
jgi:DnaK suppressor protein